ncbi:MAG: ABC transporter ATP-binding protein [Pseudomonadota bacterium]
MLTINNLAIRYGSVTAVQDFSLELADGEIITLVGPTGCGKSSVLRAVAGFEPLASGQLILGQEVITASRNLPPERRDIGLMFQDFALFPHMTVAENVGFRVQDHERVQHWIDMLGLTDLASKKPATLSGGQKQRVALARALAHAPRLVLLDEPLSNLDAALKSSLRWRIRDALKSAGVPAIWVTHDQAEALAVGDRVGVMQRGHLEQLAKAESCYRRPETRFVATFLGEGVLIPGRLAGDMVHTSVGRGRYTDVQDSLSDGDEVDVLVRPHDISLQQAHTGGARVVEQRYEGETRLYCIRFDDDEMLINVRVAHEQALSVGERVTTGIDAHHALPVFPRQSQLDS